MYQQLLKLQAKSSGHVTQHISLCVKSPDGGAELGHRHPVEEVVGLVGVKEDLQQTMASEYCSGKKLHEVGNLFLNQ